MGLKYSRAVVQPVADRPYYRSGKGMRPARYAVDLLQNQS